MEGFSKKEFLSLKMPTEEIPISDQKRKEWMIAGAAGIDGSELSHVYLSGAFPAHSDLESAITIGIFPDLPRETYTVLRNSSLDGARTVLLDHGRLAEAKSLAENIYCVQFASFPDFLVRMQAAKFIPHTDLKRFPSMGGSGGKSQ